MKKRLLALALCLVLAASLLPITAAAAGRTYYLTSVTLTADGVEEVSGAYKLKNIQYELIDENIGKIEDSVLNSSNTGWMYTEYYSQPGDVGSTLKTPPKEGEPYYVKIYFRYANTDFDGNLSFPATLDIPGYSADLLGDPKFVSSGMYLFFKITKNHEHTWQFTQTANTLTATCKNCDTPPVTLSLSAHSVTLPESPFNAWLEGWNDFQAATGAEKTDIVYKCNGEPADTNNPKAGQYQAWVMIKNLPGPVFQDGIAALADSQDTMNTAELFVQYTAADPKVTAQTGDNRPIERMMAGVVVFSALAAAAFILDNKRKYQQ